MGCSCSKNELVVIDKTHNRTEDNTRSRSVKSQLSSNQLAKFKLTATVWKQDKGIILSGLNEIMNKHNMSEHVKLLSYHTYAFHKEEYETGGIIDVRYFTFIKKSNDTQWHKKPFQDFYVEVENFFQSDPRLVQYKQFYWKSFIHEYEENWLKFTTRKISKENEDNEEFVFTQKNLPSMPTVLALFAPNDDKALLKLMEIQNKWDTWKIIPVVAEKISNKKDIIMHKENLCKYQLDLKEIYFLGKKSDDKIEKHIPYTTDDNMNQIQSKFIFIDSEGYVRKVCDPEEFHLDLVEKSKTSKLEWNKSYEEITQYSKKLNSELKTVANINLKKCRVYEHNESDGFRKVKVFYEPLQVSTSNSINHNIFTNASIFKFIKFKKKNDLIVNEINSFSKNIPCKELQYKINTTKTKKFVALNKKEGVFATSLILQFASEDFEQGIPSAYVQGLEVIMTMPFVNLSLGIYALPMIQSSVPYYTDIESYKVIIFFSIGEKELHYKLSKLKQAIQDRAHVILVPLLDYDLNRYEWKVCDVNEFAECFACTNNIKELFTCLVLDEKSHVVHVGDPMSMDFKKFEMKSYIHEEKFHKKVYGELINFVQKFTQPVYNFSYTKSCTNKEETTYENIKLKLYTKNLLEEDLAKFQDDVDKLEQNFSFYVEIHNYDCVDYPLQTSCNKCENGIYGGLYLPYLNPEAALCTECIKLKENKDPLIFSNFLPSERVILNEYLKDSATEKFYNSKCCVCNKGCGSILYISLNHFNVIELESPILICEACFEDIFHKQTPVKLQNFKRFGGNKINMIMKRICLPSY